MSPGRTHALRSGVVAAVALLVAAQGAPASASPAEPTEQRQDCATVSMIGDDPAVPAAQRSLRFSDVWGLTRGAGQMVAVIDTGVAPHPRLPQLVPGGDLVSEGDGTDDCDGHGTVVAGLIAAKPEPESGFAGGAPDAAILSIRQSSAAFSAISTDPDENRDGSTSAGFGDVNSMAVAVRAAVDAGATVVNISEVACAPAGSSMGDGELAAAIDYAANEMDAVIVVAAGNLDRCKDQNPLVRGLSARNISGPLTLASPAWFDDVIAVGSLDQNGQPSDFGLAGPWVDIAAPGRNVVSLSPTGTGVSDGVLDGQGGLVPYSGTSFATPFVSATAALIRARYPSMPAADVVSRILRTAHEPPGGWDSAVGFGSLDPVAAVTGTAAGRTEDPATRQLDARPVQPLPDRGNAHIAVIAAGGAVALVISLLLVRAVLRPQDPS
ncbi:MAG: type VII secretion-associated serine protease mycosin [Rhodococcus sp. (in: high G+C Gram-positive bacteria)]